MADAGSGGLTIVMLQQPAQPLGATSRAFGDLLGRFLLAESGADGLLAHKGQQSPPALATVAVNCGVAAGPAESSIHRVSCTGRTPADFSAKAKELVEISL